MDELNKTDEESFDDAQDKWKKKLTPEEYDVMRQKGTEAAYSGIYWDTHDQGMYKCKACGAELFSSDDKFDSKTGWPSFTKPVEEGKIELVPDSDFGMSRTEVKCARCGSHLGHVFDDVPGADGKRFCINSVCLDLDKNASK